MDRPATAGLTRRSLLKSAAAVGVGSPLVGSLLGACGGSESTSNELVVAAATTPPSLDYELVFGKEVYDHVFNLNDRLTRWKQIPAPDEEGGLDLAWQADNFEEITEPRMAEGWEITNDGRTYTFSLRKGWPSHAGNEFTAADVKWTFDRSFALNGTAAADSALSRIRRPEDVKVLDPYTVRIEIAEPNPLLLLTISNFWRAIADSKLARSHATSADPWATVYMKDHDVGFGPYKLVELSPDRQVVWEAHEEHPFPPKLERITFEEVPESSSRLAALENGHAHATQYLLPGDMHKVDANDDLRLWNFQGYVIHSVSMVTTFPPFDDARVRRALSYATPYQQILRQAYLGFAGPAHGPLSDHDAAFDPYFRPYTYDRERARELLRRAGLADGFETTLAYSTAEPLGKPVTAMLQRAFQGIGVRLELEPLPPEIYNDAIFKGKRPMFFESFGADAPDPAYGLGIFYLSSSSNNFSHYANPAVDRCLGRATSPKLTWDQRLEMHQTCAGQVAHDAPWIWIAQPGFQVSTTRDLTGINWYAGEAVDWSLVRFTS
jgi:peptide/nickel transport system substrate-binding protein